MKKALLALAFSSILPLAQAEPDSQALAEELGSLRNATVAIEIADPKQEITYFTDSISDKEKAELARIAPNLRIVTGLSQKEALARAEEAHGIDAGYATRAFLEKATNLTWVQVMSAGVDRYISFAPLMENDDIVLTNYRAVHGPAIADHSMAMLLFQTRNLGFYADEQQKGRWSRGEADKEAIALEGKTMLVVGVGGIGTEIAKRAHGFGMRVIGTRRSDTPSPDFIEKTGKPEDLLAFLPEADVVALAVPLTPETENLIDEKAFAAMKQGTYLINIARGQVVNTDAMLAALKSGKLAAACLDVTDPEPLPKDHPLWSQPNVIITPHVASRSEVTNQRRAALLRENLRRFASGEPLLNVVDKKLGY
ncbi:MAG: D-2-hydroxyacid dehydrogenase [Akkermansiaceae bacterium]|nr:D-2-hydroxyacid dehydrogenase [Akkermansiaceae bacterium]